MSKLARALTLAALLAAINLAGMTSAAHAVTAQQQSTAEATVRRLLARERSSVPNQTLTQAAARPRLLLDEERSSLLNLPNRTPADATLRRLQAQERYYSTWNYGNTPTPASAEPSGQLGLPVVALGVLAAVLALVGAVAVLAARRTHRSQGAGQTA